MKKITYKKSKNKHDKTGQKPIRKSFQRTTSLADRAQKSKTHSQTLTSVSAPTNKYALTSAATQNIVPPVQLGLASAATAEEIKTAEAAGTEGTNINTKQPQSVPLAQILAQKVLEEKSSSQKKKKKSASTKGKKEGKSATERYFEKKNSEHKALNRKSSSKMSMFCNRKAFYFYISIFACMLFIESHRFSVYFEEASNKYPFLAYVSETIEDVGKATGISTLMNTVGEFIAELSEEQTLEADEPFDQQMQTVVEHYKNIFGIKNLEDAPDENLAADKKSEIKQTDAILPKQAAEKDVKTLKSVDDTKIVEVPKENNLVSVLEPDVLQKKETDPLFPPKQQPEQKSQSTEKPKSTKQSDITPPPSQVQPPAKPIVESTPVRYAFYEPKNIVAAPTKMALDEYMTYLPDLGKKKKILLVGDSMMQGLVPLIQTALKHRNDLEIVHRVKVSTGLSNQRFFHWPDNLKKLLKQHNPHVVIVCIGANDPQDLIVDKKWYRVSSEAWEEVYSIRTINFLELATSENRKVVWIGLPIMLKEPYAKNIKRINKVFKEVNSFYPAAAFVDTHMLLTDKGKFISFITGKNNKTIRVRAKDNIHLTFAGGRVITNYMIPTLNERVGASRLDDVKGNPLIPVAGKANTITFTSHIQKKKVEYIAYLPNPKPQKVQKTQAEHVAKTQEKTNTDWQPFVATAQASSKEQNSSQAQDMAPANIIAIQEKAENPPAVEKLIAQSLIKTDEKKKNINFPVLYLLHGASGSGRDWNAHMGKELQKIADEKRVIIVAPTTGKYNWYVNSPLQKNSQMESFMIKELVPHVDALLPSNGKRGIAGLSMGGHGALLLSLKHPKTFTSTASASGVLDIRLHPKKWQINKVLGEYAKNKQSWNKNSVAYVLERKHNKNIPKQILIATGLQDETVLKDNQNLQKLLAKKKFKFEYEEIEGNHDWTFWKNQMSKLLRKQADFLSL